MTIVYEAQASKSIDRERGCSSQKLE